MKTKLKNLSFPALLLLIVCVIGIKGLLFGIINLFRGSLSISRLLSLIEQLCPFVLFYLLSMKEEQKKSFGIAAVFFGCVTIIKGLFSIRHLFAFNAFIEAVVGGPLYNVISSVLIGLLLLLLGSKLIKNENITKKYYFFCGLSLFLIAYASVIMAIANPLAILSKLPTFLYILSLWYIPKLYIDSEYQKTRTTSKKFKTIVVVVVAMYLLLAAAGGLSGSSSTSSNPNEPWKDLGVSKKEYMEVYNYYKYGEHSK